MKLLQYILLPFSLLYGFVMQLRNLMFNLMIIRAVRFDKAIISVGNLSMGGTGKTPHVEYLIRLLSQDFLVATLSRGYGRNTKGFILGSRESKVEEIGDEPMQLVRKFDGIKVAADENRKRGIMILTEKYGNPDVILLDDAFQHRYVKPGLSILLTSSSRLYSEDHVVPSGTLREFQKGANRADIIVVTKTPKIFSPISRRRILEDLAVQKHQHVFFSYITYTDPLPLFDKIRTEFPSKLVSILLLTGIADHSQLQEHIERLCSDLVLMKFSDHHTYTGTDISKIEARFKDIPTQKKVIITTEKDAMRLKTTDFSPILERLPIFYFPISIEFHGKDKELFDKLVRDFVERHGISL